MTEVTGLSELRKQIKAAETKYKALSEEREDVDRARYKLSSQIHSMPCDTVGWTDEELSRHIHHMHDNQGYVHVYGLPRPLMNKVHALVKHIPRRPRSGDYD